MNILFIDQYAGSPKLGMEFRPFELCSEFNKLGCSTMIVAGSYSHLRRKNPENLNQPMRYFERGVGFLFLPTNQYNGNGPDRAVSTLSFVRGLYHAASKLSMEFRPDVVIASSTHPFDVRAARRIAKKSGAKTVFELHDIWPLSLCELYGYSKAHPLMQLIDRECRYAFKKSDLTVSLLSDADSYLDERGISRREYAVLPNGVSCSGTGLPPPSVIKSMSDHKYKYGSLVVYAGGYNTANCPDDLKNLCELMPGVGFAAIGGKGRFPFDAPSNLLLTPQIDHSQIRPLLSMADVLWIGTKDKQIYRYGVAMNKLYDYMAARRPVVFSCSCKNDIVTLSKCGITVPPGDIIKTSKAIRNILLLTDDEKNAMGIRGGEYADKNFSYSLIASQYLKRLEEL